MEVLIILIILGLYFFPTIVAEARGHTFAGPIFIINLFLGWTLLGWVGALAWAAAPFKPVALAVLDIKPAALPVPQISPRAPIDTHQLARDIALLSGSARR